MASDVNDQVFNEKQLFNDDVVGEDDDTSFHTSLQGASPPSRSPLAAGAGANGGAQRTAASPSAAAPVAGSSAIVQAGAAGSGGVRGEKRRRRAAERAAKIVFWLETKYEVLPEVCNKFENWKESPSATYDFDLLWCDTAIAADRFMKLKLYQKMNHFVGMSSITRKNNLGRNLLRMRKQFPKDYKFFPDTWILPTDLSDFKLQFQGKTKTFIIKPDNGCQGKGIFLVRDVEKVPVDFSTTYVAQRYINKPFLLDGFKFDLRLYVLVMGCDPLRIFIHKRGLVRLASEQYVEPSGKNLQQAMVHLTNYAINKMNPNFEENTNPDDAQDGHKRSWEAVQDFLRSGGHDVDQMNADIEDLIIKTLIAVQPSLSHFYHSCQPDDLENSMCFEILGFDVMLDAKLQPWLLEVNHAPSFATESELDRMVKTEVLTDTFTLLNLTPEARRQKKRDVREKMEQRAMGQAKKTTTGERSVVEHQIALERSAWEDAHLGGYKRLYPSEAKEREYLQVHEAAISIWEMLMGGTSRRTVRLIEKPDEDDKVDDRKSEKPRKAERTKDPKESKEPSTNTVKRTPEQLKEVVDRLMNGSSARPRPGEAGRRRGASKGHAEASPIDDDVSAGVEEVISASSKHLRHEVQVGDIIKVQTNLGWESVTVRAKRTNGKVDIQFKDGEYMRSVHPRIMRDANGAAVSGAEAPNEATNLITSAGPLSPSKSARGVACQVATPLRPPILPPATGVTDWNASESSNSGYAGVCAVSAAASVVGSVRPLAGAVDASMAGHVTNEVMASLESQLSTRRRGRSAPGMDAVPPMAAPLQLGAPLAIALGRTAMRSGGIAAPLLPPTPTVAQEPARSHEAHLRQHLQQLISVRPIATRALGDRA